MPIELRLLAYSVALLFVLILVQASASTKAHGLPANIGNRDEVPAPQGFEGRTRRALYNMIEGMALFAPLVLIAAVQNIHNDMTVLGARLFFYGRIAHAAAYLVGVPYLRTAVWGVSVIGIGLIFLELFK